MTLRTPLLALKPFFAMLILFGLVFSVSVDAAVFVSMAVLQAV